MAEIVTIEKALWALSVLLTAGLFALLLYRKNYRVYPYFFTYVLITLMQSPVLLATYRVWGFDSRLRRISPGEYRVWSLLPGRWPWRRFAVA